MRAIAFSVWLLLLAMLPSLGMAGGRILLIPLDDRPASTQFAEMIGAIHDVEIVVPPADALGHFTRAGSPEALIQWLKGQDLVHYDAAVVSTDMVAYGGLIASRTQTTKYAEAIARLRALQKLRREVPKLQFYAFSAIMRIAPTATKATARFRNQLARYAETKAKYRLNAKPETLKALKSLAQTIPAAEIEKYEFARDRNHRVQQELVRMAAAGVFDYLILGQDDAQPIGPHVFETRRLQEMVKNLKCSSKVYFCEGIDQHANVLLSRVLLKREKWSPRVRIVYADDLGRAKIASYESQNVENSLRDQLIASGAVPAADDEDFDYSLYVNTPEPRELQFENFVDNLKSEIDQAFPVAVADINLGKSGTGDPKLFNALCESGRAVRLLAYAGWNTAGNTMGTAIPAANVFLLARRVGVDPVHRELAQRAFLLHRLVNDFEYHRFTRPQAYAMIDANPRASRDETYGEDFRSVDDFVREDLSGRLESTFREMFLGRRFFAGSRQYVFTSLENVQVELPWPRAYEVRLNFRLNASEIITGSN